MTAWLYQMTTNESEDPWSPEHYRLQVWEGTSVNWSVGKISYRDQGEISPGDIIVLFFSKTRTTDPGIYGWGIISKYDERRNRITFDATPPSDYLKTCVCWDKEVEKLMDEIRKPIAQGTMWAIKFEELKKLRRKIREHIGPGAVQK